MKFYHILSLCLLFQLGACAQWPQYQQPAPVQVAHAKKVSNPVINTQSYHVKTTDIHHKATSNTADDEVIEEATQDAVHYLPKRKTKPLDVIESKKTAYEVAYCLQTQLQKQFRLPKNFYTVQSYDNGAKTVGLFNPYTKKKGLFLDVIPTDYGSEIRFYPTSPTVSVAWHNLPRKCK